MARDTDQAVLWLAGSEEREGSDVWTVYQQEVCLKAVGEETGKPQRSAR